ncbi:MAG: GNAT family N-acetyltransferase [Phycisphaerales bacterium]|jgi:RimJ/RimL family protein N-acetyltransferase
MAPESDGIEVCRLGPEHTEAYVKVRQRMLHEEPWSFGSTPAEDLDLARQQTRELLADDGWAYVGAIDGDAIVSTARLFRTTRPKQAHAASIVSVWTDPAYRGRGLGRRVLLAIIDVARGWPGVELIELSVSEPSQAARRLYESLGFMTWGVQPDAMRVHGHSASERYMQLVLGERGRP